MASSEDDGRLSGLHPDCLEWKYTLGGYKVKRDYRSILHRLGKEPDNAIARELGCHTNLIRRIRVKLGIPRFDRAAPVRHLLGRVSDRQLARHLSITEATIKSRREAAGIPPFSRKQQATDTLLDEYLRQLESQPDDNA